MVRSPKLFLARARFFLALLFLPSVAAPRLAPAASQADGDEDPDGASDGGSGNPNCPRPRPPDLIEALLLHAKTRVGEVYEEVAKIGEAKVEAGDAKFRLREIPDGFGRGVTGIKDDVSSRKLRKHEVAALHEIFGDSLDPAPITLMKDYEQEDGPAKAQRTLDGKGFRIVIPFKFRGEPQFEPYQLPLGNPLNLTKPGMAVLVHEAVHVWQMQNGRDVESRTASARQKARFALLSKYSDCPNPDALRTEAEYQLYNWPEYIEQGLEFEELNKEAQARLVEDWYLHRTRLRATNPERESPYLDQVRLHRDYMRRALAKVRAGKVDP